ncbi:unnamed protein product [Nippostrongylus brasiliensis]|uniref:Myosin_tail_1 domain-containing protein n=1 Tax=Nippostrongylus brasiliensis TaxID=27835 RepID=A0A0N4YYX5_NIPBR|nr:unnamed protein product [Nippostrongylus brasiliensis]
MNETFHTVFRCRIDRERQRLQHEVIELTATIDQVQKDKHTAEKAAERFEAQTIELSNKVEDLNRHVNDLAQQRQRLQAENNDLLKVSIHSLKIQKFVKHIHSSG